MQVDEKTQSENFVQALNCLANKFSKTVIPAISSLEKGINDALNNNLNQELNKSKNRPSEPFEFVGFMGLNGEEGYRLTRIRKNKF